MVNREKVYCCQLDSTRGIWQEANLTKTLPLLLLLASLTCWRARESEREERFSLGADNDGANVINDDQLAPREAGEQNRTVSSGGSANNVRRHCAPLIWAAQPSPGSDLSQFPFIVCSNAQPSCWAHYNHDPSSSFACRGLRLRVFKTFCSFGAGLANSANSELNKQALNNGFADCLGEEETIINMLFADEQC